MRSGWRDRLNLIQRQQSQIPFRGRRIRGRADVRFQRREALHFNLNGPGPIGEAGKRVHAVRIGEGYEFLVAARRGDRSAWNRNAVEEDLATVLGRNGRSDRKQRDRSQPKMLINGFRVIEAFAVQRVVSEGSIANAELAFRQIKPLLRPT